MILYNILFETKANNTNNHVFSVTYFVSNVKGKPNQLVVIYGIQEQLGTEGSLQSLQTVCYFK
jgi:hypothetical protein